MSGGWKQNWKFSCKRQGVGCGESTVFFVFFFAMRYSNIFQNNSNSNLMPSLVLLLPSLCCIMSMVLKNDVAGWIPSVLVHSTSV